MPFLIPGVRSAVAVPPTTGVGDFGRLNFQLLTAADTLGLTDRARFGYEVLDGVLGLDMPPTSLYTDSAPLLDGSIARGARYEERTIMLPLYIEGPDRASVQSRQYRLFRALLTNQGGFPTPATLLITRPDGTTRQTQVLYAGGAEGNQGKSAYGVTWKKLAVTLRAPDPWWYDASAQTTNFVKSAGGAFLPILPLKLQSNRLGTVQITNPGDVPCYPVWTWTGPGTVLTLTNATSGLSIVLTKTLGTSGVGADVVTVNTKRGSQTVVDATGANLWAYLSAASELWPLLPGTQSCTVDVAGSTTATMVTLQFVPAYVAAT